MNQPGKRTVVVVGAGLGGISAALSLAAAGYEVDVFEKNEHVGGKLNVLEKEGFSFDLGPSILTLPQYFERLFEVHERRMADYVSIRSLSPQWRNFFEDGTKIDLYADAAETVRNSDTLVEADGADLERRLHPRQQDERDEDPSRDTVQARDAPVLHRSQCLAVARAGCADGVDSAGGNKQSIADRPASATLRARKGRRRTGAQAPAGFRVSA